MSRQSLVHKLTQYFRHVQRTLFPALAQAGVTLTPELERLVAILDVLRIEELIPPRFHRRGAPPKDRATLARAFVAKHVLHYAKTKHFRARLLADDALRRICGWATRTAVPSESVFSRAFTVFAEFGLADALHAQRVVELLGDTLVWHQALDATAIAAREHARPNPEPQYGYTKTGKRRHKPLKGTPRGRAKAGTPPPAPPQTRIERQRTQVPEIALLEIPTRCDHGSKPDADGQMHPWKGYKFHVVTNEDGIPLCAVTTAASVHDSQVAIPLLQLTARRVTALYDLMDSGYDAAAIRTASVDLSHLPIIKPRTTPKAPPPEWEPDRARRYTGRTVAERFNARLKDEAGGRDVQVKGVRKVHATLMFGLLGLFADAILKLAV